MMAYANTGALAASAMLLLTAALTPGPNNVLILRIAAQRGLTAVLAPAAGVVLGGLLMMLAVRAGLSAGFRAHPWLRPAIIGGGALALGALGLQALWHSLWSARASDARATGSAESARRDMLSVLFLQFVNPKAWVLVLTVTAAAAGGERSAVPLALLLLLFVAIPSACLALWALGGALAARLLRGARSRALLEGACGLMLVGCALALLEQR